MLLVIRQSFIIVLAMLQLFAPLVHAHTGNNSFNQGLHIPGLELYRTTQDSPAIKNVNADWETEGLLVVVDAGINNPHDMFIESVDIGFALLPSGQLQVSALPDSDSNFSPHTQAAVYRQLPATHSPRAPPAL
jgi:hypothetical protein